MLSIKCKEKFDTISLLNNAEEILSFSHIQDPRIESEIILASLLKCNRSDLYLYREEVSPLIVERFNSFLMRRLEGEPLQYILGSVEFCGFEFRINKGVFIPRPETELLVEEVLKRFEAESWKLETGRVLDIGTGCGNIAISLAKMIGDVEIVAIDISEEAIEVAKENAKLNGVSGRIEFLVGDLYKPLIEKNIKDSSEKAFFDADNRGLHADSRGFISGNICENPRAICENPRSNKFDCIVSNPPYIASGEFGLLDKEVLQEPRIALDGGLDGLSLIRRIIDNGLKFLKEDGCIFLEIGYNQADKVKNILEKSCFEKISIARDYSGIDRIAVGHT